MQPAPLLPDAQDLLAHARWLRRLARELTADEGAAEELAQDAWAAAVRARPAALRPWLAAVARNLARMRARAGSNRAAREKEAARPEALPAADELVARAELQRLVVELVLALREPYRATLLLRFYEELEPAEIARRQGLAASTVRSRLKRGIEQLRGELDRRAGGDRRAWCAALAPLGGAKTTAWIGGLLVKGWTAAAVAALAAVGFFLWRDGGSAPDEELARASTGVAEARGVEEEPAEEPTSAVSVDPAGARAPASPVADRAPVAPVADRAPVEGVLLDAASGLPLAGYALALRAEGSDELEELATDAAGRFRSAREHAAGTLVLELRELAGARDLVQVRRDEARALATTRELTHAPPFGAHELRVDTGPTIAFVLVPPPELATRAFAATLECADRRQAFDRVEAELRDGPLPWARFGATARLLSGGPPWRVRVRSADGLLAGEAELADLDAATEAPVHATLEARGRVHGRLTDAGGAPLARQWVTLSAPGASWNSGTNRPAAVPTGEDGSYDLRWLAPGSYALEVDLEGYLPYRSELAVEPERAVRADLALVAREPAAGAFLRGTVRSASGRYASEVTVLALPSRSSPSMQRAEVTWDEEAGELVGRFAFEGLEEVEHRVSLSTTDLFPVERASAVVRPGEDGIEFRVDDSRATRPLELRALEAETGAPLESFTACITVAPGAAGERSRQVAGRDGAARFDGVPLGLPLELELRADGFAPSWLEGDALEGGEPIEARLARGWGLVLTAVDAEGRALEGVGVAFDGEPCGTTDARGVLRVRRASVPSTASAVYGDWVQAERSGVERGTGRFRAWLPFLRMVLEPPREDG